MELAFAEIGITLEWRGKGIDEKAFDSNTGKVHIEIDPRYFRPTEVEILLGDPSKAEEKLGWKAKVGLQELCAMMVKSDLEEARRDEYCKNKGFKTNNHYE